MMKWTNDGTGCSTLSDKSSNSKISVPPSVPQLLPVSSFAKPETPRCKKSPTHLPVLTPLRKPAASGSQPLQHPVAPLPSISESLILPPPSPPVMVPSPPSSESQAAQAAAPLSLPPTLSHPPPPLRSVLHTSDCRSTVCRPVPVYPQLHHPPRRYRPPPSVPCACKTIRQRSLLTCMAILLPWQSRLVIPPSECLPFQHGTLAVSAVTACM